MILEINDLKKKDFQLSKINIIHQKPVYRNFQCAYRIANGFLYILRGTGRYYFKEGEFDLSPSSLIYLPTGSVHSLEIYDDEIEFYRIDFDVKIGGETVLFSTHPLKISNNVSTECVEAIKALAEECEYNQDFIRKTELLCTIFRTLDLSSSNANKERLSPAVNYLLDHLTERIDCTCLAKSCNLGSSQFYTLFKAEYGMSPLEYRDKVVIKRASMLLKDGTLSVTEIAEMLGFESVSYFSRFFKKHRGISPSYYVKKY